jgi:hypothetical protein
MVIAGLRTTQNINRKIITAIPQRNIVNLWLVLCAGIITNRNPIKNLLIIEVGIRVIINQNLIQNRRMETRVIVQKLIEDHHIKTHQIINSNHVLF